MCSSNNNPIDQQQNCHDNDQNSQLLVAHCAYHELYLSIFSSIASEEEKLESIIEQISNPINFNDRLQGLVRLQKLLSKDEDTELNQAIIDTGITENLFPLFLKSKIYLLQEQTLYCIGYLMQTHTYHDLMNPRKFVSIILWLVKNKNTTLQFAALVVAINMLIDNPHLISILAKSGVVQIICDFYYLGYDLECLCWMTIALYDALNLSPRTLKYLRTLLPMLCQLLYLKQSKPEQIEDALDILTKHMGKKMMRRLKNYLQGRLVEMSAHSSLVSTLISNRATQLLNILNAV